ncbi:dual specificity tyrosine-phosphorylation-regulated kinase 4-like [Cynoglossus semilaevis]|uniref:dual specificity tyrosine-phosphorylation-regulated kinase 4-like n=1 Tax=Cynoglossus semilaevis TaxID=244447 RepID=UPI00049819C8|nr:dual specificity tyrosine-phosphorylation-regulated kinase 4-like [Cynoglossus semilaevis]
MSSIRVHSFPGLVIHVYQRTLVLSAAVFLRQLTSTMLALLTYSGRDDLSVTHTYSQQALLPPVAKGRQDNPHRPNQSKHTMFPPVWPYLQLGAKSQRAVLPPISKGRQEHAPGSRSSPSKHLLLPPISKSPQYTSRSQRALPPTVPKGQQEYLRGPSPCKNTTLPPISKCPLYSSKGQQADLPPVSKGRQNYLRQFLTDYELDEIKHYRQVWYMGEKLVKVHGQVAKYGFDTKEGYYRAFINDHLAYRFQILKVLGEGSSGQVLKCMDHKSKEHVAVKIIRNSDRIHQVGRAEVNMLKALGKSDHNKMANIVHMKENFYFRSHLCITFELLGKDLRQALRSSSKYKISDEELRKYTMDMLTCLQLLKNNGIVHSDLKPVNILLYKKNEEKHAAVGDFGGSYFVETTSKPITFTVNYASPEVLLGKSCGPAADMWSLGCTIAEVYLGHRLFAGHNFVHQFDCIMEVLGLPPAAQLVNAPRKNMFFDNGGIPLKIEHIISHRTNLTRRLNSTNDYFVNFIKRCLEYDPLKRMTPAEAMQHPWIRQAGTKSETCAEITVSPCIAKPVLLRRNKPSPVRLQPVDPSTIKRLHNPDPYLDLCMLPVH